MSKPRASRSTQKQQLTVVRQHEPPASLPPPRPVPTAAASWFPECASGGVFSQPRYFWAVAVGLLVCMAAGMLYTAWTESATVDEPVHILAGAAQLRLGEYHFSREHAPLGRLLAAALLVPLDLRIPTESPQWQAGDLSLGIPFVFANRASPDEIVLRARAPFVALSLAFGAGLALWVRRHFGAAAGLLTLGLYSLDPAFIAHGHLAATDLVTTVNVFLACLTWERMLRRRRAMDVAVAGACLGLALCSKFSALVLLGLLPLLLAVRWWQARDFSLWQVAAAAAGVTASAAVTIGLLYGPETWRAIAAGDPASHAFYQGIRDILHYNSAPRESYLLGKWIEGGKWYYFPVVFAVKTPLAVLAALALVAGPVFRGVWSGGGLGSPRELWLRLKRLPFAFFLLSLPPAVYFAAAMGAGFQIGHRHILPVYPFLFALIGALLSRFRFFVPLLVLALLALEHALIAPHYLAFFNLAAGGSRQGSYYLVDSNLDWGQDFKNLRDYLRKHQVSRPCLAYFGPSPPRTYGVAFDYVPDSMSVEKEGRPDCLVAISASLRAGLWNPPETYAWLRQRKPDGHVGYSIYLYDFRQKAAAKQGSSN